MAKVNPAGEIPKVHSNADAIGGGRLSAPSALRNREPIIAVLAEFVPKTGRALEIASGTGEHVVAYAQTFSKATWQPTDIAPERLGSIEAWARVEGCENVLPACLLDAGAPDWNMGAFDLVVISNLFHLIGNEAAQNVIAGAVRALNPLGVLFIYGPFRKSGNFRSQGDGDFHARIQANDTLAGYKDIEWMQEYAVSAGLTHLAEIEMPANNLSLVWRKPA